jgi:hypothetical protein
MSGGKRLFPGDLHFANAISVKKNIFLYRYTAAFFGTDIYFYIKQAGALF